MISENIPESGELAGGDAGNKIARNEDESPYSSVSRTPEEEHFDSDENLGFAADPLRCKESKWNDTTYYVAKKKLKSWFQLPDGKWELARILSTSGTQSVVTLSGEKVLKVNSDSLTPANPDILDGVDDLMQLS